MPFFAFLLSRPEAEASTSCSTSTGDELPTYTKRVMSPPRYTSKRTGHSKQLSTIAEEEDCDASDEEAATWSSTLGRFEYSFMLPQALLVDASTTLCAYLYFTSLQARLVLQQQSLIDVVSSICGQIPTTSLSDLSDDDVLTGLLQKCTEGISQSSAFSYLPLSFSHRFVILFTLLKACIGYLLLTSAAAYVRPFDYLVASGAVHCLALYCFFFVPVASYLEDFQFDSSNIWMRISVQFFWILLICSTIAFVHFIFCTLTSSKSGAIALPRDGDEVQADSAASSTCPAAHVIVMDEKVMGDAAQLV